MLRLSIFDKFQTSVRACLKKNKVGVWNDGSTGGCTPLILERQRPAGLEAELKASLVYRASSGPARAT